MTQEDKELLLKDLCARLPYGIVINTGDKDLKLDRQHQSIGILYPENCSDEFNKRHKNASFYITISGCYYGEEIKLYLRPMSSMTEEEKEELRQEHFKDEKLFAECLTKAANGDSSMRGKVIPHFAADWCNKNHFDYRGLIPMGIALEAHKGMYNLEKK